jgi:membrane protease YdiL (CAAX protease family)
MNDPVTDTSRSNGWPRVLAAFAAMFVLYQAAEGLQTVIAPGNPLGPILMLAALLVAWPLGRWLGWRGYDAYGLQPVSGWAGLLIGGMLLAAMAKLSSLALSPLAGAGMPGIGEGSLAPALIATVLLTTFVPSVAEDILTRGFLLRAIPVRLGAVSYVLASAALYTANHVWRFDWGLTEQVRLFCLGLAYGAAAWRWRSLWGAVALHWGWNLANALAGPLFTVDGGSVEAARLLSAMAHLALLAIVLCLPARERKPTAQP